MKKKKSHATWERKQKTMNRSITYPECLYESTTIYFNCGWLRERPFTGKAKNQGIKSICINLLLKKLMTMKGKKITYLDTELQEKKMTIKENAPDRGRGQPF
jgi:hypothetical protein